MAKGKNSLDIFNNNDIFNTSKNRTKNLDELIETLDKPNSTSHREKDLDLEDLFNSNYANNKKQTSTSFDDFINNNFKSVSTQTYQSVEEKATQTEDLIETESEPAKINENKNENQENTNDFSDEMEKVNKLLTPTIGGHMRQGAEEEALERAEKMKSQKLFTENLNQVRKEHIPTISKNPEYKNIQSRYKNGLTISQLLKTPDGKEKALERAEGLNSNSAKNKFQSGFIENMHKKAEEEIAESNLNLNSISTNMEQENLFKTRPKTPKLQQNTSKRLPPKEYEPFTR